MSETGSPPGSQPAQSAPRRAASGFRISRQRLVQIGCLPITLALAICLVLFLNLITFQQAPYWVTDPIPYLISGRLVISLGTLAGLQVVSTWGLGLVAAASAAPAVAGQSGMLRQRLAAQRRRIRVAAWAVLLLRLVLLIAVVVAWILVYTTLLGLRLKWDPAVDIARAFRGQMIWLVLALIVGLGHWFAGPFLRLRYSLALGALAAAWASRQDRQPLWLAVTARLGAGMLGALALLWGGVLIVLVAETVWHPFSYVTPIYPMVFPALPRPQAGIVAAALGLTVMIIVYLAGQITLPHVFLWLAQRRLARASGDDRPKSFVQRWAGETEEASLPGGEAPARPLEGAP